MIAIHKQMFFKEGFHKKLYKIHRKPRAMESQKLLVLKRDTTFDAVVD